ncbi:hypothetical protein NDU88_009525 [Pleurodeles waltl]|uniref:Uncharacterized protein n=1 Tax=Pleurodeles waltl TaxID=8319 RepID=A0AAV7QTW0_PLEWA|nr:hypothetical protein NDU88_009525 [Pleurodeles waltl]
MSLCVSRGQSLHKSEVGGECQQIDPLEVGKDSGCRKTCQTMKTGAVLKRRPCHDVNDFIANDVGPPS